MEMPQYGAPAYGSPPPAQAGPQQSGVMGAGGVDAEQGQGSGSSGQELPPRPAKAKILGVLDRFRR